MTKFSTDILIEPGGRVIANPEFYNNFPFNTKEITDEEEIEAMQLGDKKRDGGREKPKKHGLFVYSGEDVMPFAKGTSAVIRSIIEEKGQRMKRKENDPNKYHFIDHETRRSIARILAGQEQEPGSTE